LIDFTIPKVFTNSELQMWQWCRQKWEFKTVEKLRPVGYGPSYHLHLGSAIHEGLQRYYDPKNLLPNGERDGDLLLDSFQSWHNRELEKVETFLAQYQRNMSDDIRGTMSAAYELGSHMLMGYRTWAKVNDDFDVLETERKFVIPVYNAVHEPVPGIYYAGKWDGIVRNRTSKKILVFEHKTVSDTKTGHLVIDQQHTRYIMAAREILGWDVVGSLHNMLRKQKPGRGVRVWLFNRQEVHRSDDELEMARQNMLLQIDEMANAPILPSIRKECQYCEYLSPCLALQRREDATDYIEQNYWTSTVEHEEVDYEEDFITIGLEDAA